MRILNRPMFKYGGPIKEGVMHGMKNGGLSKQFNTGLVGDERYPQTGGREHHGLFIPPMLYAAGAAGLRMLARPFAKQVIKQVPKLTKVKWRPPVTGHSKGYTGIAKPGGWERGATISGRQKVWEPTWLGQQFKGDPLAGAVMSGKGFVGGVAKKGLGLGKYAFGTPSGLLFMGLPVTYYGGKYLLADGTELNKDQIKQIKQEGPPGGGDPGMFATPKGEPGKTAAELAAEAKAARKARTEKYLDTMGYDKAKKTAMGDALIDASAIVQQGTEEGGSLKHADWSKMINQAIQATGKRLDKPEQIREAVGLMQTKADIQKDVSAEENALAKLLTTKKIEKLNKDLEGNSFRENLVAVSKTMSGQEGIDTAVQLTEGKNFRGNIINVSDFNKILKKMKNETGMDDQTVIIQYAQAAVDKNPGGFEDGHYTVGNNVITVKDDQVIAVE